MKKEVLFSRVRPETKSYLQRLTKDARKKSDVHVSTGVVIDRLVKKCREKGILSV